jgi:putative ABC transport system substrate-binding protein
MASHIGRRKVLATLGGAAVWPLAARAQQPVIPVIGFLSGRSPSESPYAVKVFHQGLKEGGYVEGQNAAIEYRWAEGQYDRLPALAADLVRRRVAVIAVTGAANAALAAKAATATIPIVFTSGVDPVRLGLVASLNRPGGNATGINFFVSAMEAKRLGLLRELIPTATLTGVLLNPSNVGFEVQSRDVKEAANALGLKIHVLHAQRTSHSCSLHNLSPNARWRPADRRRPVLQRSARTARDAGGPLRHSGDLRIARIR